MPFTLTEPVPTRPAVETAVLAIVQSVSPEPVEPALESEVVADLGFDSVLVLELVAELEDHFEVTFPLDTLPALRTVRDMVDRIVEELTAQEARAYAP